MPSLDALKAIESAEFDPARDVEELANDLDALFALLTKWQRIQNLVSRETLSLFWQRHVADSLQILKYSPVDCDSVLDLGSGGGFPSLPMAIALKETGVQFKLIESNSRKVAFLRAVGRELGLNMQVFDKRIDEVVSRETGPVSVITARALASLEQLCAFSYPFWSENTVALLHKGREHVEEIKQAGARWDKNVLIYPSVVDREGVILELRDLRSKAG